MIGGPISATELPQSLLPATPANLTSDEIEGLWEVFVAISTLWGSSELNPLHQRSQWLEFIEVRTTQPPSYVEEYRSALSVIEELKSLHPQDAWNRLMLQHGAPAALTNRLAHARKFVVEEFIRVWLLTGGFKAYGAGNYNGYISGSRFAVQPSYRRLR